MTATQPGSQRPWGPVLGLLVVASLLGGLLWRGRHPSWSDENHVVERSEAGVELLSQTYTLDEDQVFTSMTGPSSTHYFRLIDPDQAAGDAGVWVTGIDCQVVGGDGRGERAQDFMCHANVEAEAQPGGDGRPERLFTLVPGRTRIALPEGFGIPLRRASELSFMTMVLNLNRRSATALRFRTRLQTRPGDEPLRPLFRRALYTAEVLDKAADPDTVEECCGVKLNETVSNAPGVVSEKDGQTVTIHWWIAPNSSYEKTVDVTAQLALPSDTSVHYLTGHLHPYGKWIALRDDTTGQELARVRSRDFDDRLGVAHMDELTFPGQELVLRRDHRYSMITRYENPTERPIDAMSILYLYLAEQAGERAGAQTLSEAE